MPKRKPGQPHRESTFTKYSCPPRGKGDETTPAKRFQGADEDPCKGGLTERGGPPRAVLEERGGEPDCNHLSRRYHCDVVH